MGHVGTEELLDPLDRRERVLDHVVQQARDNRHDVEALLRQDLGDAERMGQIGLARPAHLPLVLHCREHVRAPEQLNVGVRADGSNLVDHVFESNHGL